MSAATNRARVKMFRWGKRNQGFVWHEYVRTTIVLRREARRDAIEQLKQQAVEGARAAKDVANEAAREGARNLGAGSRIVAVRTASGLGIALRHIWAGLVTGLGRVWAGLGVVTRMAAKTTKKGAKQSTLWFQSLTKRTQLVLAGVAATIVLVGVGLVWSGRVPTGLLARMPSLPSLPFTTPSQTLTGRATVVGPGLLKLGETTVRLADIEALDREQTCLRGGKRWRCGDASITALQRLTAGRNLSCVVRATGVERMTAGACRDGQADIASALVKGGYAFAAGSFAPAYAADESAAKTAKLGLWAGESERPDVWRSRIWEEAKKARPDGCAIKAVTAGGARVYVMPWSADYERARIDPRRGGRWFCTEQEAKDAGWKPG
jgi:endonuclease YncB( thermonuclease family)